MWLKPLQQMVSRRLKATVGRINQIINSLSVWDALLCFAYFFRMLDGLTPRQSVSSCQKLLKAR